MEQQSYTHEELFGDLKDAFFTTKEAAEYLEISSATLGRYIKDGKIQAKKVIGKNRLFDLKDLRKLKTAINLLKS